MRNKNGSSLGLIAICLVTLVFLGIFFFMTVNIFGGTKQVADATDSGTVAVTKLALVGPKVNLTTVGNNDAAQFLPLCDPIGSQNINLLTYNRLVGYALLVSINANSIGTTQAQNNAKKVWTSVQQIGQLLTAQLENSNNYANYFNSIANYTNTSFLNLNTTSSHPIQVNYVSTAFKPCYYNSGKASNIYVSQSQINSLSNLSSSVAKDFQNLLIQQSGNDNAPSYGNDNSSYIKGYTTSNLIPDNIPAFIPESPNVNTHLISKVEYENNLKQNSINNNSIPPNCFQVGGQSKFKNKSFSTVASAISMAVVGIPVSKNLNSVTNSTQSLAGQYPLSMPGGYIKIYNYQAAPNPGFGNFVSNGSNDIFNNELYSGKDSGIGLSNNGVFIAGSSSTVTDTINAWAAYNNPQNFIPAQSGVANAPKIRNPKLYPPNLGYPAPGAIVNNAPFYRIGSQYNQQAAISDLENITAMTAFCSSPADYGANSSGPCIDNLDTWINNYGAQSTTSPAPAGNYTAVEYMKTSLLEQRPTKVKSFLGFLGRSISNAFGGGSTAKVLPYGQPTGLKLFDYVGGIPNRYPSQNCPPSQSPQYGTMGSPWQLLAHVGNMNYIVSNNTVQADSSAPPANFVPQPGTSLFYVYQRCQEIKPNVTLNEIYNALNSQIIALGQTFYLYLNPKTNTLTMDSTGPVQYSNLFGQAYVDAVSIQPDGNQPGPITQMQPGPNVFVYAADDTLVDTSASGGGGLDFNMFSTTGNGDANFATQPYEDLNGSMGDVANGVTGYDAALWVPASGYHNFLGMLEFMSDATGGGIYSRPN